MLQGIPEQYSSPGAQLPFPQPRADQLAGPWYSERLPVSNRPVCPSCWPLACTADHVSFPSLLSPFFISRNREICEAGESLHIRSGKGSFYGEDGGKESSYLSPCLSLWNYSPKSLVQGRCWLGLDA